jgi:hypothetical protein
MKRLKSVLSFLGRELLTELPTVIFFFVAFNLVNLSNALMFHAHALATIRQVRLLLAAMVVGRLLPVLDLLPFVDAFRGRPLILATLWKSSLYSIGALAFRVGKIMVPQLRASGSVAASWREMLATTNWLRFFGLQIWIVVLLIVYVGSRELTGAVGPSRVRKLFFGCWPDQAGQIARHVPI